MEKKPFQVLLKTRDTEFLKTETKDAFTFNASIILYFKKLIFD